MNIDQAFPSKYLKSADITAPLKVSIKQVVVEVVDEDKDERKPILYFHQLEHGLVLNKTNANALSGAFGAETDSWTDKMVGLWVDPTVQYAGKTVPGLRIKILNSEPVFRDPDPAQTYAKEQAATAKTEQTTPDFDDNIPFG